MLQILKFHERFGPKFLKRLELFMMNRLIFSFYSYINIFQRT